MTKSGPPDLQPQLSPQKTDTRQDAEPLTNTSWIEGTDKSAPVTILSANELTSISALIAYVAHNSGEAKLVVESRLAAQFNVPDVSKLPTTAYDAAIRFLVDNIHDLNNLE